MPEKKKVSAIVLAAGSGKRMGASVAKQYLPLLEKPLMVYALETFAASEVDEIVLVVAPGEVDYCKEQIVRKYELQKITHIIEGGRERYDSVYAGLHAVDGDFVLIHDSARAFITTDIIHRAIEELKVCPAVVVGVPAKDTVKIVNAQQMVEHTPKREDVWMVQTPQCFSVPLIRDAYDKLMRQQQIQVTDDAMVVEQMCDQHVKMLFGSYENIKVTTPEDMTLGEGILRRRGFCKN